MLCTSFSQQFMIRIAKLAAVGWAACSGPALPRSLGNLTTPGCFWGCPSATFSLSSPFAVHKPEGTFASACFYSANAFVLLFLAVADAESLNLILRLPLPQCWKQPAPHRQPNEISASRKRAEAVSAETLRIGLHFHFRFLNAIDK